MENYIDALLTIEKQFKPIVLDQSTISTKELTSLCEKNLYHVPQIKMILFSFHQLVSLKPWKYNSQPSWEGYNYIHEQYKNIYKKAVEIDNKITNKNDGISFSYELLQIQEKYFSRNRIIVLISYEQLQQNEVEISTTKSTHEFIVDIKFKFDKVCKIIQCVKNDETEELLNFVKEFGYLLKKEICIHYNTNKLSRAIIASLPYFNLHNDNKNTETIVFILSNVITDKQQFSGLGGMFLLIDKQCLSDILLNIFCNIGDTMAIRFVQYYQKKILKSESLKSAVSAIMTRNMSHNLGSHYLHYTKTQLENLAKKGGEFGPDIRGAAKVMEYMQGRMDYLATLVSGDRFPYGCVNFKSQIYDVLTVDDFSKRHYDNKTEVKTGELNRIRRVLKDAEKKNFGNEALENCLPDLSQLFSKAITNDAYNRTTNFLLTNLILSENFTRPNILEDTIEEDKGLKRINLQVLFKDKLFTGSSIIDIVKQEDDIKRKLSEINIAMPGGVMSCHAFFNIIENFIRNSAKYLQSDFSENNNLTITIKIAERIGENAETIGAKGEKLDVYEFTIFDNKHNANKVLANDSNTLLVSLRKKLEDLSILDSNNAVEKNNKGIKEMLFSAIWLRSYVYQNVTSENTPNSYEDVLLQIQSATTNSSRLDLIKDYGFSFLSVDDHGVENNTIASNLALRFTLPKFNTKTKLTLSGNDVGANLSKLLHIYGDVTCVDDEYSNHVKELNKGRADSGKNIYEEDLIIPRMLKYEEGVTEIGALKKVLHARFGKEFDKYQISSGSSDDNLTSELENQYNIYFERHLSTKCDNMEDYKNFAYADSVSGGNYTITLSNIYNRWAKNGRKDDSEDYYEILKIKESALTRITLIDERLYNKMRNQKTETELACKNIRILNYNESNFSEDKIDNFIKLFTDDHKFNNGKDETHFLSIHLGIIEKIVKNADMFTLMKDKKGESISVDGRVKVFMRLLKEKFGPKVFISVHSGRGNFSAELEDSLDMYPFISMAALENVYENSKYLLSQLFYSTIYVGKGVANQHNPQY